MDFNLTEQLAIIKMIDSVIIADDVIHQGEINILNNLILQFGFESNFLFYAKDLDFQEALLMLNQMSLDKKKELIEILYRVSKADGHVHRMEINLIAKIFSSIGITNTTCQ